MSLTAPQKELNVMRESSQLCRRVQKSGEDVVREILAEPRSGSVGLLRLQHCVPAPLSALMKDVRFRTRVGSSRVIATHLYCSVIGFVAQSTQISCQSKPGEISGQQGRRTSGNRAGHRSCASALSCRRACPLSDQCCVASVAMGTTFAEAARVLCYGPIG
jgi:hypothetical protein